MIYSHHTQSVCLLYVDLSLLTKLSMSALVRPELEAGGRWGWTAVPASQGHSSREQWVSALEATLSTGNSNLASRLTVLNQYFRFWERDSAIMKGSRTVL